MSDANQVRINELARELEVKAKAIIDLLAGYGVTEKKTHSSSIPADVAEKVRKKLLGQAEEEAAAERAAQSEKEAKEAAAKAARMRPASAPVAAPAVPSPAAPPAVKPVWVPEHTVVLGLIVGTGSGLTVTVVLVESIQLVPLDTTTE